jgi:hypothetical protein
MNDNDNDVCGSLRDGFGRNPLCRKSKVEQRGKEQKTERQTGRGTTECSGNAAARREIAAR